MVQFLILHSQLKGKSIKLERKLINIQDVCSMYYHSSSSRLCWHFVLCVCLPLSLASSPRVATSKNIGIKWRLMNKLL